MASTIFMTKDRISQHCVCTIGFVLENKNESHCVYSVTENQLFRNQKAIRINLENDTANTVKYIVFSKVVLGVTFSSQTPV